MNAKAEKKIRQMFRREIREKVDNMTQEYFGDAPIFNVKPNLCPQWLWSKLIAFIIDTGFLLKYENHKRKEKEKFAESQSEKDVSDDSAGSKNK